MIYLYLDIISTHRQVTPQVLAARRLDEEMPWAMGKRGSALEMEVSIGKSWENHRKIIGNGGCSSKPRVITGVEGHEMI